MFIKIENFSGIVPRLGPTELADNQAQFADNVLLASSELRPWGGDTLVYSPLIPSARSIYRLLNTNTGQHVWCTWTNDVNVVPGQISDTTDFRIYYTGDGPPKKTNWVLARQAVGVSSQPFPNSWQFMGIPNPKTAPTLVATQTVKRVSVTAMGSGYTTAPTVVFTTPSGQTGTSVTARAELNASISTVEVNTTGTGYKTKPTVQFVGGGGGQAEATATITSPVASVSILFGGTGYTTTAPTVTFTSQVGDTGSGATGTAIVSSGVVTQIAITNGGSGYTVAPLISFSGGSGAGPIIAPIASANLSGGVQRITVTNGGSGYTSAPSVSILGMATTPATATASISGGVGSVIVESSSNDYSAAPVVSFTGGGGMGATATADFGTSEVRAYIYTYINVFGSIREETGPSPAGTITVGVTGSSVTISNFAPAPSGTGYNVRFIRIYRTVAGSQSTIYAFVAEIPVTQTSYTDTKEVSQLGESFQGLSYQPPPDTLRGIVAMPNGMFAGFTGNEVWFCEPYLPHAWPSRYAQAVTNPIVGLGVFGNTLVVLTTGEPFLMTGTTPESVTQEKLSINQPCVAKRSIVSDQYGVMYASPFGLVSIGPGSRDIITTALFTSETWKLFNPDRISAAIYNNRYVAFYVSSAENAPSIIRAFVLTRGDTPPLVELNLFGTAIYNDLPTGGLYYVNSMNSQIYLMNDSTVAPLFYRWKSKKFVLPKPVNFSTFKVQANFTEIENIELYNKRVAEIRAANELLFRQANGDLKSTFNSTPLNTFPINGSILMDIPSQAASRSLNALIYGDGILIFSTTVTSQDPIRLPNLTKRYVYEVELTGTLPVRSFIMATSTTELKEVNG